MARIDALLFIGSCFYHVGDQLVVRQSERDGMGRFASERTAEPVDVEALGRVDIVDWKRQMKQDAAHFQRPCTVGVPDPSHQPAAMCGVTCAIENRPAGVITNVPAAPSIRETSWRRIVAAARRGLMPAESLSQMAFATAKRMMPSPWPVMDTAPLRLSA